MVKRSRLSTGISISLCMIVKNEERDLPKCLDCAKSFADEIIIVDTGSTDHTVEIARRYTDLVYHFQWVDDFAAARNFSFSKATKDYILWLDADDIITPENIEKFKQLKIKLPRDTDFVLMSYHCLHDEQGNVITHMQRERLVKRNDQLRWHGAVHETLSIYGKCLSVTDMFITHTGNDLADAHSESDQSAERNLRILEKVAAKPDATYRELAYYGNSLYEHGRYDEALAVYDRLFTMKNTGSQINLDAYIYAHRIYKKRANRHQAASDQALRVLTEHEPLLCDKAEFYCELGDFYAQSLKQPDNAFICYQKALGCNGLDVSGIFIERNERYYYFIPAVSLGLLLSSLGMYPEALTYLDKALTYDPSHEKTIAAANAIRKRLT